MTKFKSNRYLAIWAFCIVALLLCSQFYFSIRYEEPYPCLKLPGFGSIPGNDTLITSVRYKMQVKYQNDKDTTINCRKAFPSIPQWYIPFSMKSIVDGEHSNTNKKVLEEFQIWLQSQLIEVYHLQNIRTVVINKEEVTYDKNRRQLSRLTILSRRSFTFTSK